MNWYKIAQIRGEWWIINGHAVFADSDVGDMGHEAYVLDHIRHDIAETMDYGVDEIYDWDETKQAIITNIIKKRIIDPKPLIKQYGEDFIQQMPYKPEIFDNIAKEEYDIPQDQLNMADGSGDIRKYGMEKLGWKRMAGNNIETQTLTEEDLKDICRGISSAYDEVTDDTEFTIEIQGNKKVFWNIPFSVMEQGVMALAQHEGRGMMSTPTYANNMNWYKKASVERLFHWTCNVCGNKETKQGYGLPKGWEWYGNTVNEPEVKHKCPNCAQNKTQDLSPEERLLREINKK